MKESGYDAIVIGAGISGLGVSALLAKDGMRVLTLAPPPASRGRRQGGDSLVQRLRQLVRLNALCARSPVILASPVQGGPKSRILSSSDSNAAADSREDLRWIGSHGREDQ